MLPDPPGGPPPKRRKFTTDLDNVVTTIKLQNAAGRSLDKPISPPLSRRRSPVLAASALFTPTWGFDDVPQQTSTPPSAPEPPVSDSETKTENEIDINTNSDIQDGSPDFISSPFQLTKIQDLTPHQNVDAVGLKDILGDPMIKECWNFNFLFDLDFVMQHFDRDVRDTVKVKIIHGFWKRNDDNMIALLETAERYPNIELLSAYIPDPFGTHHSKMLVLFRHDDLAQVIIHTANMISRDWGNMTQAIWKSPLLPILPQSTQSATLYPIGSGKRFKADFLRYLGAYERRLSRLVRQLEDYDFSNIRAAFIGSAPSRQKLASTTPQKQTSFGWLGLREILSSIPTPLSNTSDARPHIIIQISSIATSSPAWHTHFQSVLAQHAKSKSATAIDIPPKSSKASTFFAKREPSIPQEPRTKPPPPNFNIIFPTAAEIRASLDGYASGHSIHMKLASAQQQTQLAHLRPLLCYWITTATTTSSTSTFVSTLVRKEALRGPAAPHIKTYIRFTNDSHKTIDWAMLTSANLSTQAWGAVENKKGEVWIQSWEAGVVVWPALFAESNEVAEGVVMVPVFGRDGPGEEDAEGDGEGKGKGKGKGEGEGQRIKTVVGLRMPYDLPLSTYADDEVPWCASQAHSEPDWKGRPWPGFTPR